MVEPSRDPQYKDSNKLGHVVVPGEPECAPSCAARVVPAGPEQRPAAQGRLAVVARRRPGTQPAADARQAVDRPARTAAAPAPAPSRRSTGPAWLNG